MSMSIIRNVASNPVTVLHVTTEYMISPTCSVTVDADPRHVDVKRIIRTECDC